MVIQSKERAIMKILMRNFVALLCMFSMQCRASESIGVRTEIETLANALFKNPLRVESIEHAVRAGISLERLTGARGESVLHVAVADITSLNRDESHNVLDTLQYLLDATDVDTMATNASHETALAVLKQSEAKYKKTYLFMKQQEQSLQDKPTDYQINLGKKYLRAITDIAKAIKIFESKYQPLQ
jgi:hypothetical protein